MSFQAHRLSGVHDDLAKRTNTLTDAIKRQREFVYKLYYGESPKKLQSKVAQFHVDDFRKILRKDYAEEGAVYEQLCEYVHPNYGSNLLVSSGVLGAGQLNRPAAFYSSETATANSCIEPISKLRGAVDPL